MNMIRFSVQVKTEHVHLWVWSIGDLTATSATKIQPDVQRDRGWWFCVQLCGRQTEEHVMMPKQEHFKFQVSTTSVVKLMVELMWVLRGGNLVASHYGNKVQLSHRKDCWRCRVKWNLWLKSCNSTNTCCLHPAMWKTKPSRLSFPRRWSRLLLWEGASF